MKLIRPYFELQPFDINQMMLDIEAAGRTCYKSEEKITDDSAKEFIKMIIRNDHETVLEHEKITVRVICDRGVSHEIVRHRIASYSQESTRYCNYKSGVTFIVPPWVDIEPGEYKEGDSPSNTYPDFVWYRAMLNNELHYKDLLSREWTPQQARSVLPNSLKTEVVMTMNLREWRHFFKLRTAKAAHPQMREIAVPMLEDLKEKLPVLFNDIN